MTAHERSLQRDRGREVGRYRLLTRLGEGGMAIVHLARDRDLDRLVALKELNLGGAADASWATRFLRESRLIGSLKHPNIVTVFDYLEQDGTPYIAMEYAERGSLRSYVGVLTFPQTALVLEGVLAGLAHAERRGIVHRDLKPENLLVTEEGAVMIADFGIAKVTTDLATPLLRTAAGMTVGTPLYMAPEQALGSDDLGPWTDLYGVGCIAYELFTGAPPFATVTGALQLMLCHINQPIPPAASVNANVDTEISDWIDSLLVKDPAQRVRAAGAAWDSLEEIVLARLGPRWHRSAALPDTPDAVGAAPALATSGFVSSPALAAVAANASALDTPVFVSYHAAPTPRPPVQTPDSLLAGLVPWDTRDEPSDEFAPALPAGVAPPAGVDPFARTRPPAPRAAPTPPAPAPVRRVPWPLVVAGGLVAVAVAAVVLIGGADDDAVPSRPAPTAAAPSTLTAEPLSVRLPAGWERRPGEGVGALALTDAAVAGPPGDAGGTVAIGLAPAKPTTVSLLPAELARDAPRPTTETLAGGLGAYRYDGLDLGGAGAVVYVVPTESGVATVACRPPPAGGAGFAAACDGVARSLVVRDARGPSQRYADEVAAAVRDVNRALSPAAGDLRRARTPAGQAGALQDVGTRVHRVAARLRRLELSPADAAAHAALVGALTDLGDGLRSLESGARGYERARYARAATAVRRTRQAARGALGDLRVAGYRSLPALSSAAIAPLRSRPKRTPAQPAPQAQPAPTAAAQPAPASTTPRRSARPAPTPGSAYGPPVSATPEGG